MLVHKARILQKDKIDEYKFLAYPILLIQKHTRMLHNTFFHKKLHR